ncbi:response regulator [bacterium]|nr:response regulator [bacterium]HPF36820.1 response regulator [Candidatus Krumholzibacteria bacterium]HRX52649.1 response regulator [Candidatus Krumholzibacteria bacterium]
MGVILIVEDRSSNLAFLATAVGKLGYRSVAVGDGAKALAALGVDRDGAAPEVPDVDAVFLDVRLPDLDGREVARRVRAAGLTDLPIIAVTAMALAGDREACLAAGMNDYLAKPLTVAQVGEALEKWVG